MILESDGSIANAIELRDHAAKNGRGRRIPMHRDLREALVEYQRDILSSTFVVTSERGGGMTPLGIVIGSVALIAYWALWVARHIREEGHS